MEPRLGIKEVNGLVLVRKFSEDMETMLRRKVEAIQVLQVPWSLWVHPSPGGGNPREGGNYGRQSREERTRI